MVLATARPHGTPSARVVLCKGLAEEPGLPCLLHQLRVAQGHRTRRIGARRRGDALGLPAPAGADRGPVTRSPAAESDAYFASRAWQSRIGAWASEQSRPIGSRAELIAAVTAAARRFGTPNPADPARRRRDFQHCRARRTGAAIGSGPRASSCGRKARRASMTASPGHAHARGRRAPTASTPVPGRSCACSPDTVSIARHGRRDPRRRRRLASAPAGASW